mmetsp:Transcript_3685/g.7045  ORF Transcript_3685/g.7045 Transcript_3685/m.7045 type:complete len:355 (+) Transcript_3685:3-1067(+)
MYSNDFRKESFTLKFANLSSPLALTVDQNSTLYICDTGHDRVLKVPNAHWMNTKHKPTILVRDLKHPRGLAVTADGYLVISDTDNHRILCYDPTQKEVVPISGSHEGFQDGLVSSASFRYPCGVDIGARGEIFICDLGNNAIRMIKDGVVSTIAGGHDDLGKLRGGWRDGLSHKALFDAPFSISVHQSSGDAYVSEPDKNRIRKLNYLPRAGGSSIYKQHPDREMLYTVETLLGKNPPGHSDSYIGASQTRCPTGLHVDFFGQLYFADTTNNVIRHVDEDALLYTYVGSPRPDPLPEAMVKDGEFEMCRFSNPVGLARDPSGRMFVSEPDMNRIRLIDRRAPEAPMDVPAPDED